MFTPRGGSKMDKLKHVQKGKTLIGLTSSWYAPIKSFFSKVARQNLKLSSNFTDSANAMIMSEIYVLTGGSASTKI